MDEWMIKIKGRELIVSIIFIRDIQGELSPYSRHPIISLLYIYIYISIYLIGNLLVNI